MLMLQQAYPTAGTGNAGSQSRVSLGMFRMPDVPTEILYR